MDTWPGYELITVGPDGRSKVGFSPWRPGRYRTMYSEKAGALVADPEHELPFTVAFQERPVSHGLPRLLHP